MNAITTTAPPLAYNDLERLAESIAKSNLFGIKTRDQAIALMMIAHAEGRHPALAARDYDIIQGRPAKKAEAMMRDFLEAGGKIEWHSVTDELADATFTHPQTGSVRIDWDMKRAMTAFGKKDMYQKFPRQMLRSRVVSEGVRTLWPLATSGFHVPEEIGDMKPANVEHNGPTIEPDPDPVHQSAANKPASSAVGGGKISVGERTREQWDTWLSKLNGAMMTLYHDNEIEDMSRKDTIATAHATGPNWVRAEIDRILSENYARVMKLHRADDGPPDDDEVRIVGEEKMAAG